jgi:hypothetical protein
MSMTPENPEPETKVTSDAGVTRRDFVSTAAGTAAAFMIVPRHVLGRGFQAPSDLLNIATVGINGMGRSNTEQVMSQNIVAICDCDFGLLDLRLKAWQDGVYPPAAEAAAGRVAAEAAKVAAARKPQARRGRSSRTSAPRKRSRMPTPGGRSPRVRPR